jgi:hypothetical protein
MSKFKRTKKGGFNHEQIESLTSSISDTGVYGVMYGGRICCRQVLQEHKIL